MLCHADLELAIYCMALRIEIMKVQRDSATKHGYTRHASAINKEISEAKQVIDRFIVTADTQKSLERMNASIIDD